MTISNVWSFLRYCFVKQFFFSYAAHASDRSNNGKSNSEENIQALFALIETILIGSFAVVLALHRSQVIDKSESILSNDVSSVVTSDSYEPPNV